MLPVLGEPDIVHAAVPPGGSVLDLGCVAHGLLALCHDVVGVDQSQEMLRHVPAPRRSAPRSRACTWAGAWTRNCWPAT